MDSPHPAFDLIGSHSLPEYRGTGLHFRHRATGCEVYHLLCDEIENTFAFGFRTPSRDSTGAAHIVEHSVLCGSERYPVKDPFLVMVRRSLATYLNALTYPDRTVYPASSAVEADYFNLMAVYGDAVFFPLLTEDTFLQEGHRLELLDSGALARSGVVFNEMRGDYSSADSLTSTISVSSLFEPGHPYSFDSGGDPSHIVSLTYEGFLDFWAEHYRPSNCRIFLYGNIDTGRQLAFLQENFLSRENPRWKKGAGSVADAPVMPLRDLPRRMDLPCPPEAGSGGSTSIIMNWLLPPLERPGDLMAVELLGELLVGHDGAPLAVALRNSGLGEDLSPQTGLDTNYRQPIFSVGLRGIERGREDEVEAIVISTLRAFVEGGAGTEELDTAFHSIAFANREIRRGAGTYGTRLMSRAFRTWIRGDSPEEGLAFAGPLAGLEAKIKADPDFIGSLARRLLLDNGHRTTLTAFPAPERFRESEASAEAALAERLSSLSPADRSALSDRSLELARAQARPDSPEDLATLPRLHATDIPREIDVVPRETSSVCGCGLSLHPLFTNGIVYLDLAFPVDRLGPAMLLWLPFFARFVASAGAGGLTYDRMAARLARYSGGFGALLETGSPIGPEGAGAPGARSYVIFRLKALAERFPAALELAFSLLTEADTSDRKRVTDVLAELGNDVVSALVPSGSSFALARAGASLGGGLATDDLWRGMSQFRFLQGLRAGASKAGAPKAEAGEDIAVVASSLDDLRRAIVAREGLRLNLTADAGDLPAALAALGAALPGLPSFPAAAPEEAFPFEAPAACEAYEIPSQVGFAAAACPASRIDSDGFAHESVLAHFLTTGPLWDELRVKRGAYGASCYLEGLEGAAMFSTYRDPRPVDSLAYFGEALRVVAESGPGSADAVEEALVGTAGRDLRPLLPEERGLADFRRELYGINDELRRAKRRALLATGPAEVREAAHRLSEAFRSSSAVLISRKEDVQLLRLRRDDTRAVDLTI